MAGKTIGGVGRSTGQLAARWISACLLKIATRLARPAALLQQDVDSGRDIVYYSSLFNTIGISQACRVAGILWKDCRIHPRQGSH
jgi:hypothetical protein